MRAFDYERAGDIPTAISHYRSAPGAAFVAGGTTLLDLVKLDVMTPTRVIDINRVGLNSIEQMPDGGFKVGALVRNSDLAWHPEIRRRYPVLAEALLSGASAQLRNMATTAGNIMQRARCQYFRDNISPCNKREPGSGCAAMDGYNRIHAVLGGSESCIATHASDMCVALAVLDADVVVQNEAGERRIPFSDFHLLPGNTPHLEHALSPGEMITAVMLPALPEGTRSWYVKLRDRASYEFALAAAAVVVRVEGGVLRNARVGLGGVATKPWRARAAEAVLQGAPAVSATFERAAAAEMAAAQPREHNAFKPELCRRVIIHALATATAGQPTVRNV